MANSLLTSQNTVHLQKKTLSCNIVTSQGATSYNSQYLWQLVDETFELPSFKGTFPSVPVVVVAVAVEEGRIIKRSRDIYSKCDNRVTVLLLIVFLSLPPPSLPPLQRFADYQYQSILPLITNKLGICRKSCLSRSKDTFLELLQHFK